MRSLAFTLFLYLSARAGTVITFRETIDASLPASLYEKEVIKKQYCSYRYYSQDGNLRLDSTCKLEKETTATSWTHKAGGSVFSFNPGKKIFYEKTQKEIQDIEQLWAKIPKNPSGSKPTYKKTDRSIRVGKWNCTVYSEIGQADTLIGEYCITKPDGVADLRAIRDGKLVLGAELSPFDYTDLDRVAAPNAFLVKVVRFARNQIVSDRELVGVTVEDIPEHYFEVPGDFKKGDLKAETAKSFTDSNNCQTDELKKIFSEPQMVVKAVNEGGVHLENGIFFHLVPPADYLSWKDRKILKAFANQLVGKKLLFRWINEQKYIPYYMQFSKLKLCDKRVGQLLAELADSNLSRTLVENAKKIVTAQPPNSEVLDCKTKHKEICHWAGPVHQGRCGISYGNFQHKFDVPDFNSYEVEHDYDKCVSLAKEKLAIFCADKTLSGFIDKKLPTFDIVYITWSESSPQQYLALVKLPTVCK